MSASRLLSLLCLAGGSVLLSCADIAAPSRTSAYEWRRIVPTAGGPDTLGFHWPQSRLPVRFWAEDTLNLPVHVQHAIGQWQAAFLYGEFRGELVADSSVADVIVTSGIAPKGGFSVTRFESFMAPECQGATDVELDGSGHRILPPIRVYVDPRFAPAAPGVDGCMALTTTHELGHSLGIFAHSPNADDIMFADPIVAELSPRDRATAELAYHTEPTLTVAPR
ncbi:MAG: Matrixin [Gemmatimonadales bacterium]|jgi:predicted Zn-dependent protease|nr:Matrixin [Gemmatimonadales bacterium]